MSNSQTTVKGNQDLTKSGKRLDKTMRSVHNISQKHVTYIT